MKDIVTITPQCNDYCKNNIESMKEAFENMENLIGELKDKCYIMNHKIVCYESRIERLERLISHR